MGFQSRELTLKDGGRVRIRPIRPADQSALIEGFRRLTFDTVYRRFLSPMRELSAAQAHRLANVDYVRRMALVAEPAVDGPVPLIAVARYEPTEDSDVAEVAIVVSDYWQNKGLGRVLLRQLVESAVDNGIHRFCAEMLADNHTVVRILRSETTIEERRVEWGTLRLFFSAREGSLKENGSK